MDIYSLMMLSPYNSVSEFAATILRNSERRTFIFAVDRMGVLKSPPELYEICGSQRAGSLALAVAAFANAHFHDRLQLVLMVSQGKYHAYVLRRRSLLLRSFLIKNACTIELSAMDDNPITDPGPVGKIPLAISKIAEVAGMFSRGV